MNLVTDQQFSRSVIAAVQAAPPEREVDRLGAEPVTAQGSGDAASEPAIAK
jgi:hypothetical protein